MGNLVTTVGSIGAPLITSELLIPFIYHPLVFSSNLPFKQPSTLKYCFWYLFFNCLLVGILSVIGSSMSSLKECNKRSLYYSVIGTYIPILMTIFGLSLIYIVPLLKAPLLVVMGIVPYSKHIVDGLFLAFFVMIGGYLSNKYVRRMVCETNQNIKWPTFSSLGLNPTLDGPIFNQ